MLVKETTKKRYTKLKRNASEMEKERVERNGKETLTAFCVTLGIYIYIYSYTLAIFSNVYQ